MAGFRRSSRPAHKEKASRPLPHRRVAHIGMLRSSRASSSPHALGIAGEPSGKSGPLGNRKNSGGNPVANAMAWRSGLDGLSRPFSIRAMVGCSTLTRCASSVCVNPHNSRAHLIRSPLIIIRRHRSGPADCPAARYSDRPRLPIHSDSIWGGARKPWSIRGSTRPSGAIRYRDLLDRCRRGRHPKG
jgi:hypothetical protein